MLPTHKHPVWIFYQTFTVRSTKNATFPAKFPFWNVGETLRAALNSLAVAAPNWLKQVIHPDWFDRYGKRVEEYRFPDSKTKRQELAQVIGMDGMELLSAVYSDDSPDWLRTVLKPSGKVCLPAPLGLIAQSTDTPAAIFPRID